jgi:hypothetical protein
VVRVLHVEGPAAELFRNQSFCSVRCLRAYLLETLETLEPLDTPEAAAIVTDLHVLYQAVAKTFAEILAET